MRDASEDLSKSKDPNDDAVIDTAVTCDGSWHKRGFCHRTVSLQSYLRIMVKSFHH